jgi:hypothetical protein
LKSVDFFGNQRFFSCVRVAQSTSTQASKAFEREQPTIFREHLGDTLQANFSKQNID